MLYLFGQLALSDSLYYHEDFPENDCPKDIAGSSSIQGSETAAWAELINRREIPTPVKPLTSRVPVDRRA